MQLRYSSRRSMLAIAIASSALTAGTAHADPAEIETADPADTTAPPVGDEAGPRHREPLKPPPLSYWQDGEKRWFVSSNIEAGAFLKPQIAVGYGQPHWQNVTAEGYGITTTSFGAGYIGVRAALPFLSFRLGFRDTYSYYRSFLPVKSHYVSDDVGTPHGARAHYQAFEAELGGVAPVLDGYVIPVITTYAIAGVPGNHYVFDESLRGVMKAPYIAGFRLAYVKNFGKDNFLNIGALSELVVLPGREGNIVRVGPVAHMALTDHMDALAILSVVVNSPDSLGLFNGSFGVLGISYRWATGDPHPAFP